MTIPMFIEPAVVEQLIANGRRSAAGEDLDPPPAVKLFTPDAGATWLLTEVNPRDPDLAFGLCDLGMGCPELGYVSLGELATLRGPLGLSIEVDGGFVASGPLSRYADEARAAGRIAVPQSPSERRS